MSNVFTPFLILTASINYFPRFYSVKQALPEPPALISAAWFKIGDHVQTITDTTPGVDSRQSVAFYGVVEEVIADAGWIYFIKSVHESRIHMLVTEARVLSTSKSLSDDCVIETRAFHVQLMFAAQKEKTSALKRKTVQETSVIPIRKLSLHTIYHHSSLLWVFLH